MFCNRCGKQIEDDKILCEECENQDSKIIEEEQNDELSLEVTEIIDEVNVPKESKKYKVFGIISMIIGIIATMGIFSIFGLACGICAIVFANISKKQKDNEYAYVGKICGIVGVIITSLFILF